MTPPQEWNTPSAETGASEAIEEAELAGPETAVWSGQREWANRLADITAVGLGGLLGACARYQIGVWIDDRWPSTFPWATLAINGTGCLALGFYLTLITERFAGRPLPRLFIATGVLGGYTTFSTFAYEAVRLAQHEHIAMAAGYVVATLLLGFAATVAGTVAARAL